MSVSKRLPVRPTTKISPRDIISYNQIEWDPANERVIINGIKGYVSLPEVADTNSMLPVFKKGHTPLLMAEFDRDALEVGDIIVYASSRGLIIHRIVEIGIDAIGKWYKCKGDYNFKKDPEILRQDNIAYLFWGVIY